MIYIYTNNFYWANKIKRFIKFILGKSIRGPESVFLSLKKGLDELNVPYCVNKILKDNIESAVVLSGINTLKYLVKKKKEGKIKKLIAGPNIFITPLEEGKLVLNKEIDAYIVPAQWSVDWWSELVPEVRQKMRLWPAGVSDVGNLMNPYGKVLVMQKNAPDSLLKYITKILTGKKLEFKILFYGSFSQQDYFNALKESKLMIYLSTHESQGIILHEAWMANVPTLVWNPGAAKYKEYIYRSGNLSSPYLTSKCGLGFNGENDFVDELNAFLENINEFSPREYSLKNFTNKLSALKLLKIISEI